MYKKTVLSNGVRVVTHDIPRRDSLAIGIWVGVGGRYEEDQLKGVAHFFEHIVFKGTAKYSCQSIKERIEGVGGSLNAFTTEEQTCYYAKIPSKHINQTFDVLADMVLSPKITAGDVTKEKTVVIEEIKMYHDLPQYFVLDLLDGLLWPNHPLGRTLTGTPETVSSFTPKDLRNFHQDYYVSSNIVVAACGDLEHERIVKLVEARLGKLKGEKRNHYLKAKNNQIEPRTAFFKKNTEQMHLALGMLGLNDHHKDKYVVNLLNTILGGNMSSRLFVEIREKRGLAYSISTTTKTLHDTGAFMVRAGVDNHKIVETVTLILKEFEKIKQSGVGNSEFTRARDYLMGQLLLGLEDTMDHMLWLGEGVISRNEVKTLSKVVQEFEKITPADVKRVAKDILNEKRFNLSIVGPMVEEQESELKKLLISH